MLGIFTGRDAVRVLAKGKDPAATALKHVMTKKPATMPPRSYRDRGAAPDARRRLPPRAGRAEGVVIGIVSRGDFRGLEQDRLDEETGIWERMR